MTGAGVLTVFVARVATASRSRGTSLAISLAGVPTVVLMSSINFSLHSDFSWVLLIPALAWLAGTVLHVMRR